MPDLIFSHPRLAEIYDALEGERADLELYHGLVAEFGARMVLDVGCGTGTFACELASRGAEVFGIDPAEASLNVARTKAFANGVHWILGTASEIPALHVDLATMTGNVAQVFTTQDDWVSALRCVGAAVRPAGRLAFESRVPQRKAWLDWNRARTYRRVVVDEEGPVQTWVEVVDVAGSLVTFETRFVFERDGTHLTSRSTLCFRSRDEIADSVSAAGLVVEGIRDAPDRPGLEFVFVARRPM